MSAGAALCTSGLHLLDASSSSLPRSLLPLIMTKPDTANYPLIRSRIAPAENHWVRSLLPNNAQIGIWLAQKANQTTI